MSELIGAKFNRLIIQEVFYKQEGKQRCLFAKCLCDCGNTTVQKVTRMRSGLIKSCGCWKAEKASERLTKMNFKTGHNDTCNRLYRIWASMRNRCNNPNNSWYKNYGGRGILVCQEWDEFLKFESWSLSNGYSDGLSIDRIDVNGNYSPNNCRWTDRKTQARNRRNNRLDTVFIEAFGIKKSLQDWLDDKRCSVSAGTTICYRIGAGWTPEDAISKPSERHKQ